MISVEDTTAASELIKARVTMAMMHTLAQSVKCASIPKYSYLNANMNIRTKDILI